MESLPPSRPPKRARLRRSSGGSGSGKGKGKQRQERPSLASTLPVELWRCVVPWLDASDSLDLGCVSRATQMAVGEELTTLHLELSEFAERGSEEALHRLLRRFPNLVELRSLCSSDEAKVSALLRAIKEGCCGRRLRVVDHSVPLPSPRMLTLVREAYGSDRLPELRDLLVCLSLQPGASYGDDNWEEAEQALVSAMADVVEALRGGPWGFRGSETWMETCSSSTLAIWACTHASTRRISIPCANFMSRTARCWSSPLCSRRMRRRGAGRAGP